MANQTLANILTVVRRHLNEPTAIQWTDAELTAFINDGQRFLVSELLQYNPDYQMIRATTPCVIGQDTYPNPLDLFGAKTRRIWITDTAGSLRYEMMQTTPEKVMTGAAADVGMPTHYCYIRGGFMVNPIPDAAYVMEMWYNADPPEFDSSVTTTVSLFDRQENEVVALWAAVKAKNSRGENTDRLTQLLEPVLSQVRTAASTDAGLGVDYDPIG